jgi:hypothetical protein
MLAVGTWNLENRPGSDFGPSDDGAYRAKLDALAATITRMSPDVLAVQEVGDPAALDDLVTRLDGDWHRAPSMPESHAPCLGHAVYVKLLG